MRFDLPGRSRTVNWLAGIGILVSACTGEPVIDSMSVSRDSAGINIAESRQPRFSGDQSWAISATPDVRIGAAEGDSTQMLFRVTAAVQLADGRVVIAHGASPLLRWYSADGRFLHGTGRPGGGPGEFGGEGARIQPLWPLEADSVAAWEHSARRMQVFDPSGRFTRSVTLDIPPNMHGLSYPQVVGILDRGFIVHVRKPYQVGPLGQVSRDTLTYYRHNDDGSFVDEIAKLPGYTSFTQEVTRGGRTFPLEGRLPFGPGPHAWTYRDRFYYGSGDRFEIAVFDAGGQLLQLVRRSEGARELGPDLIEAYKRQRMANLPPDAATGRIERVLDNVPYPDSTPAHARIRVDREGMLWVEEYAPPNASTIAWSVFDGSGAWLTDVMIPSGLDLLEIGRNHILAVVRDELDVEYVHRYRLVGRQDSYAGAAVSEGR